MFIVLYMHSCCISTTAPNSELSTKTEQRMQMYCNTENENVK